MEDQGRSGIRFEDISTFDKPNRIAPSIQPSRIVICSEDGETLLEVALDGTVTGTLENASEAGRVFVQSIRDNLQQ